MKTLTDGHHVFRVSNEEARKLTDESPHWQYITKRYWKAERAMDAPCNVTIQQVMEFMSQWHSLQA